MDFIIINVFKAKAVIKFKRPHIHLVNFLNKRMIMMMINIIILMIIEESSLLKNA